MIIENLNAARKLQELFRNAVYIDSKPPQKSKNVGKQIKEYHHFVAPIKMKGTAYRVLITVPEKQHSDTLYIVNTEPLQMKNSAPLTGQNASQFVGAPFKINISDLVNGVKIYDYHMQKNQSCKGEVVDFGSLYSVNGRKISEDSTLGRQGLQAPTSDTISISDLLDMVNEIYSDILPKSVAAYYKIDRKDSKLGLQRIEISE